MTASAPGELNIPTHSGIWIAGQADIQLPTPLAESDGQNQIASAVRNSRELVWSSFTQRLSAFVPSVSCAKTQPPLSPFHPKLTLWKRAALHARVRWT